MCRKLWVIALSGAAAIALVAAAAAAPLGTRSLAPAQVNTLVEKVHRCHHRCRWGRFRGWHRHVGPFCRPIRWGCRRRFIPFL
jgi:hypothetical protein